MNQVLIGIIIIAILICFFNREQFNAPCSIDKQSKENDLAKSNTPKCITGDRTANGKTTYYYHWNNNQVYANKPDCEKRLITGNNNGWTLAPDTINNTEYTDSAGKKYKLYCPN
jgi:hypothetical protein